MQSYSKMGITQPDRISICKNIVNYHQPAQQVWKKKLILRHKIEKLNNGKQEVSTE